MNKIFRIVLIILSLTLVILHGIQATSPDCENILMQFICGSLWSMNFGINLVGLILDIFDN